ncbi:MAG: AAA family ATPase [Marinifilaceae bacterium]
MTFKQVIKKLQEHVLLENFKFQEPTDRWVWISDCYNVIGDETAHYEIISRHDKLYVELHFENNNYKLFRKELGNNLSNDVEWFNWHINKESLRLKGNISTKANTIDVVVDFLVEKLLYLEKILGAKTRMIMKDNNLVKSELSDFKKILKHKKQIILQGPPGTGKTYTAKDIAEEMIFGGVSEDKKAQKKRLEESEQFELVQFHPSYSYEDFVRGISAKASEKGIEYEVEDKVLAKFAKEANEHLLDSKKPVEEQSKKQWIEKKLHSFIDVVQEKIEEDGKYDIHGTAYVIAIEDDAFRYTGEKWSIQHRMKFKDIIEGALNDVSSRQEFKTLENITGLAKQHASYYYNFIEKFKESFSEEFDDSLIVEKPTLKNYVLIIDEINRANLPSVLGELIYALEYRGEKVSTMYEKDGDSSIIIPENLFIIGTMNTADRSVGSIDYAIKRRFAFKSILPNVDVIENQKAKELFEIASELFVKEEEKEGEIVKSNSIYLASDFDYQDVQIGHSYFMLKEGSEEEQNTELKLRLEYEILPLLHEYVKDGLLMEMAKGYITENIAGFVK